MTLHGAHDRGLVEAEYYQPESLFSILPHIINAANSSDPGNYSSYVQLCKR